LKAAADFDARLACLVALWVGDFIFNLFGRGPQA
jgi:hypothetical protein